MDGKTRRRGSAATACIPNPAMLDIITKHADLEGKKFCDAVLLLSIFLTMCVRTFLAPQPMALAPRDTLHRYFVRSPPSSTRFLPRILQYFAVAPVGVTRLEFRPDCRTRCKKCRPPTIDCRIVCRTSWGLAPLVHLGSQPESEPLGA